MAANPGTASCLVCRRRKIKCDRSPGFCHNCRKFGADCAYPTDAGADVVLTRSLAAVTDPNSPITQAGFRRRRIYRSCVECRRSKAKCSGGDICARCARKALSCFYHDAHAHAHAHAHGQLSPPSPPPSQHGGRPPPLPAMPAWLMAKTLPTVDKVRELVDLYFAHIHTVRCMGFLHTPSFMERFKDPTRRIYAESSGLVHAMCALAAPFYYAAMLGNALPPGSEPGEHDGSGSSWGPRRFFDAGKGWAAGGMQSVFANLGNPDIESLMTEILLHEYYLRCGEYAKAFLISGMVARHIQVLQLNLEHDYDVLCTGGSLAWTAKESRRRLVWCSYLMDAFIECGIDQLRFVDAADVQVQLPCAEEQFIRNKPCITELLTPGALIPGIHLGDPRVAAAALTAASNLDLRAYYIRVMAMRAKVLKYVKHLDGEVPWEEPAPAGHGAAPATALSFAQLNQELHQLQDSIPENFQMSPANTYVFRASGQLNLYFGLHILVAQTFNDLYRIGVSHLVFPNSATRWIRENAPAAFLHRCHRTCASNAVHISSLLEELWRCHRPSVVDTTYAIHAQVCTSVLVTTLASWKEPAPLDAAMSRPQYRARLQSNIQILDYLRRYIKADLYYESACYALRHFDELPAGRAASSAGDATSTASSQRSDAASDAGSVVDDAQALPASTNAPQYSLEYILNPLGVYPMARKQAHDRHEPQSTSTSASTETPPGHHGAVRQTNGNDRASQRILEPAADELDTSAFYIWDWESEVPTIDNLGYPTFLMPC